MTIKIGAYNFDGPYLDESNLRDESGVYAIFTWVPNAPELEIIYIGESGEIWTRVDNHNREDDWERESQGHLRFAAFYCDKDKRRRIEKELIAKYKPVCCQR